MSNLAQLNDKLFELWDDVKNNKIDPATAKTLNHTAGNIINNAKVQLNAIKTARTAGMLPQGLVDDSMVVIEQKKTSRNPTDKSVDFSEPTREQRELMEKFAKSEGFESRLAHIRRVGAPKFNDLFSDYLANISTDESN